MNGLVANILGALAFTLCYEQEFISRLSGFNYHIPFTIDTGDQAMVGQVSKPLISNTANLKKEPLKLRKEPPQNVSILRR